MSTVHDLFHHFLEALSDRYSEVEARHLIIWLFEERLNIRKGNLPFYFHEPVPSAEEGQLLQDLERLKREEPIQYVLGKAYFLDLELHVNPSVFIPRPETEELVARAIHYLRENPSMQNVFEIGTGSGNIAIALAKHLPWIIVTTVDIDPRAIEIAIQNAEKYNVRNQIRFLCWDIRSCSFDAVYDFVISNPPYVPRKDSVDPQVRAFEPEHAVFTSDDEGMEFYKLIHDLFLQRKAKRGILEIYEKNSERLRNLFCDFSIRIEQDLSGRDRFLWINP